MAQAVDQAERERELTKQALASTIDRLEARVRAELDWKARLRRDGPRYAVVGVVVVVGVTGILVLRRALSRDKPSPAAPGSLEEIAAEVMAIRKRLDDARIDPDGSPLWQKVALRAITAGAGAGGTFAARRFMARSEPAAGAAGPGH